MTRHRMAASQRRFQGEWGCTRPLHHSGTDAWPGGAAAA